MGWLNLYINSPEALAEKAREAGTNLLKIWEDYLATIPKKEQLIGDLATGPQLHSKAEQLARIMKTDLVDITNEEKTEQQLLDELEAIEHAKELRKIQTLQYRLNHEGIRDQYVHELLSNLYVIIKHELHIIKKVIEGAQDTEKLILNLHRQFVLERAVVAKINALGTFNDFFLELLLGIRVIRRMDAKEKRTIKPMSSRMSRIFANELTEGITYQWAMSVYEAIQYKVHAMVGKGLAEHNPDIDFEFVNGPGFVELVRGRIQMLRSRPVSERVITAFVYLFRQWYNYERG